jgi:hypothetical protein
METDQKKTDHNPIQLPIKISGKGFQKSQLQQIKESEILKALDLKNRKGVLQMNTWVVTNTYKDERVPKNHPSIMERGGFAFPYGQPITIDTRRILKNELQQITACTHLDIKKIGK